MALFPTEAVAMAYTSLQQVVNFVGMSPLHFAALGEQTGGLNDSIRNVAILTPDHIQASGYNAVLPDGTGLPPVAIAQWGLIWRIARRIATVAGGGC